MERKVIYKFKLKLVTRQPITSFQKFEVLCVKVVNDEPYLWALVTMGANPENTQYVKYIETYSTGEAMNASIEKYIDTYMLNNGEVYHVFEAT